MSYDLMVFDVTSAPRDDAAFLAWYEIQTAWRDDWDYDDPDGTTPALHAWFDEMRADFPAMNGPHASHAYDDAKVTGYTIGPASIYVDFRWSIAEEADAAVRQRATKHGLGFYDVSGNGEIVRPD